MGTRLITVKMPEIYLDGIDDLVRMGRYMSRSEAIRVAVRELLRRELWGTQPAAGTETAQDVVQGFTETRSEEKKVLVIQ